MGSKNKKFGSAEKPKPRKWIFYVFGLVLPTFLFVVLFWYHDTTRVNIVNEVTDDGRVKVTQAPVKSGFGNLLKNTRAVFQVPFDLSEYRICFQNRTTAVPPVGRVMELDVDIFLTDQGGGASSSPIRVPKMGVSCTDIRINPFILGVQQIEAIPINPEILGRNGTTTIGYLPDVSADTQIGAQPTFNTKIVSTLIFLLAYGGIFKLVSEYIKWAKKTFFN